jgi:hypothetical protein
MLFKEIITVYTENHRNPKKYKIKSYLLIVKQLVYIVTTRL